MTTLFPFRKAKNYHEFYRIFIFSWGNLFMRYPTITNLGDAIIMSNKNSNSLNVPNARDAMDQFKMEAAQEVGVNLKKGYNGDLTSREAGSVGGQMVKKMIEAYEKNL